jgi:hypothetical protein
MPVNASTLTWTDPTANTDGSAIQAGEITGYNVGVRPASGSAGTYPFITNIANPGATTEMIAALQGVLAPGVYMVAVQATGPVSSAWSNEGTFTVTAPPPPTPNPPSDLKVA